MIRRIAAAALALLLAAGCTAPRANLTQSPTGTKRTVIAAEAPSPTPLPTATPVLVMRDQELPAFTDEKLLAGMEEEACTYYERKKVCGYGRGYYQGRPRSVF